MISIMVLSLIGYTFSIAAHTKNGVGIPANINGKRA